MSPLCVPVLTDARSGGGTLSGTGSDPRHGPARTRSSIASTPRAGRGSIRTTTWPPRRRTDRAYRRDGIRYADDGYVEAVVPAYRLDASSEFGRLHDNAALLVEEAARRVAVPPARALKGRRSRTADPDRWARSLNWEGRERRNLNDVVPASVVYRRAAPQAVNDGERLVEPLRPDTRRGVFAEGLKFDGDATQTCPEHDATAGKPVE